MGGKHEINKLVSPDSVQDTDIILETGLGKCAETWNAPRGSLCLK